MKKAKDNSLMGIELYSCTNKVVLKEMLAQTLACLDIVCRVLKKKLRRLDKWRTKEVAGLKKESPVADQQSFKK